MSHAKENNLSIKARHSKVLFCGSSRSGKTNFINLLLNKDFVEDHKSTGVTESHQLLAEQVKIKPASGEEKHNFEVFNYGKQVECLQWCLLTGKYHINKCEKDAVEKENTPLPTNSELNKLAETKMQQDTGIQTRSPSKSDVRMQETSTVKDEIANVADTAPWEPPDVWDILTFLDTGGQPEFITMLPALNSSAMITFIVHSMEGGVEHLTDKITVYEDGEEKYRVDYNYYHLIKMLFSMRNVKTEQIFEELLVEKDKKSDRKCYLSLVGTKSDLVEGNLDKVVDSIRNELGPIISTGERECLLMPVDGEYFVPVTNLGTGNDERDPMAHKFCKCIYDCLQKRDVYHIPIVWLILELEIQRRMQQKNQKVIHFNRIVEICKKLDLIENEEDIRLALKFFHHIGVFLYYDSELKNIEDIVITNYQWVFENLTQMVKAANSNIGVFKQLRLNGILKEQAVNHINWKLENVKKEYFLKLLEKLRIICPTKEDGCEYFMPCVLPTCNIEIKQKILEKFGIQCKASHLLMQIVYEKCNGKSTHTDDGCYLFPTGVFCYLINKLLLKSTEFNVQQSSDGSGPCVFNNLITFFDNSRCCYIVLMNELMYLKVELRQLDDKTIIDESVFPKIKSLIKSTLEEACEELKFDVSDVCIAFQRLVDGETKHYRINAGLKNNPLTMCDIETNEPVPLNESEKVWFSGKSKTQSEAPPVSQFSQNSTYDTHRCPSPRYSQFDNQPIQTVDQFSQPSQHDVLDSQPTQYTTNERAAFIVYTKEEDDPDGDQVLCLSNLLIRCGISCDVDLYHTNDNILDWSSWVENNLKQCTLIILVCSPTMYSVLVERNDSARVEMVAAYINRLTLRQYLDQGVQKFLPVCVDKPSANFIPTILAGKICYHFPYKLLSQIPEGTTAHEVLDYPDFASLRSLVATLTGQKETSRPNIGQVPQLQSTVTASFTGAGTNHPTISSTEEIIDEGLISHDELKSAINEISIVDTNDSAIPSTIQILLVTANETEYFAALTFLSPLVGFDTLLRYHHVNSRINKNAVYVFGKFGNFYAAVHHMTKQGPAAAQDVVTVAGDCFGNKLNAIFAVGVACGVEGKSEMLDVLVSKTISVYTAARISTGSDGGYEIENRGSTNMPVSSFLQTYFDQPPKWPGKSSIASRLLKKPTQRSGNILSGNYLTDHVKFKQQLLKSFAYNAIGIEMEGTGLIQDYPDTKYRIVVIKAVCNFGNSKKDKKYQPTAAMLAVECLKHCIGYSPHLPQNLAKFCGNQGDINIFQSKQPHVGVQQNTERKERKIPKDNLMCTLDDLTQQTKDKLEEFDNNTLDIDSDKKIIDGVSLLLMVVNSSEFYAAMNYFSRNKATTLISKGDIYYVGKWGKIPAALVRQSKPGIAGPDGSTQLTIASIDLFKNLEVIIALGVCGTMGRLGDVVVSSRIDGCDDIKIIGNDIQIINRSNKCDPGRKIYKCLMNNYEIWSFLCTKQGTEKHEAKAVLKPMLSGVPLVASAEYRDKLKEGVSIEAGGLEMEGIGVIHGIASAEKRDKIEFIIVKAGCDYADEEKSKEWQPVAAMAAADFVYHQLTKPNWLLEKAHSQSEEDLDSATQAES